MGLILIFAAGNGHAAEPEHRPILLVAGMQKTVELKFHPCSNTAECIRVGNKALFEMQYSREKSQLIFTPIKAGETTVTIRDERGDIQLVYDALVVPVNLPRLAEELRDLLHEEKHVTVGISGDHVLVDGSFDSIDSSSRLNRALEDQAYKGFVLSLARLSPKAMKDVGSALGKALGGSVTVKPWRSAFLLEGRVSSPAEAERITQLARKLARELGVPAPAGGEAILSKLSPGSS